MRLLHEWITATTPPNIVAAFREAGIVSVLRDNMLMGKIERAFAVKVRHFHYPKMQNPTIDPRRLEIN